MTRTRRPAVLVLAAAGLLAAGLPAHPAVAAHPAPPLAFTSDRDGDADIFLRAADGTLTQLTDHDANDYGAVWSPDGTRLAFVSDRDGDDEIYVMDARGRGVVQLTRNTTSRDGGPALDQAPAWSPDGTRLAFVSNRSGGESEIWVMRSDGRNQLRLTRTARWAIDHAPAWSPDGTRIAFSSNRTSFDNTEIWTMDPKGRDLRRLTTNDDFQDDNSPHFSPDGRSIAFSSNRAGQHDVYVMRADGSRQRLVTGDPELDEVFPRFTPDGQRLVFSSFPRDAVDEDIWVVDRDGGGREALSGQGAAESFADPRPAP